MPQKKGNKESTASATIDAGPRAQNALNRGRYTLRGRELIRVQAGDEDALRLDGGEKNDNSSLGKGGPRGQSECPGEENKGESDTLSPSLKLFGVSMWPAESQTDLRLS